jgi:hypothetical protein
MNILDQTYHVILSWWAERGHAPHFTDVARALDIAPEDGRQRLHDVIDTGLPNWLFPGTTSSRRSRRSTRCRRRTACPSTGSPGGTRSVDSMRSPCASYFPAEPRA